jgi:hypothetical protein
MDFAHTQGGYAAAGSGFGRARSLLGRLRSLLPDAFNQRDELEAEIREAKERLAEIEAGANDSPQAKAQRVAAHLDEARKAAQTGRTGLVMRELAYAQQEMIPLLPASRAAAAIAELRSRIDSEIPDERRTALLALVDDAVAAQREDPNGQAWREKLFAAKLETDECVYEAYRRSESSRDAIVLLGVELFAVVVLLFLTPLYTHSAGQQDAWFQVGNLTGRSALWVGFLSGAFGACLRALYGFTSNRTTVSRYETRATTAIRPLVGGAAGLFAVLLLASGVVRFGADTAATLLLVCMAVGIAGELWLMGAVDSITGRLSIAGAGGTAPPTAKGEVPSLAGSDTSGGPGSKP